MRLEERYDVLVAGGGVAGIAAAVSAARSGARTLLIERYGFLGGMGTAGLVNPFMSYSTSTGERLVGGIFRELCDKMQSMGAMLDKAFDPEALKYTAQEMVLESGAQMLLHSWADAVEMSDNELLGLHLNVKQGRETVYAKCIVDATGDADVAALAGAPYESGNPEHGKPQAMTLMFTLGGVDMRESLAYARDHHDQMRFPKPPPDADLDRMLRGAVAIAGFYEQIERARAAGEFPLAQDMVFFITLPTYGQVVVNTTHVSGMDGTRSEHLTEAEVEGRRQAFTLARFMRKHIPGFQNSYLLQTATQVGVRETRRILGEYVFSEEDVVSGAKFADCILKSAYPVDVHSSAGKGYDRAEDKIQPTAPPAGDWYEVPYRCLIPRNIDNLLVAGRCISATHEGQGAVRIMPNCIALGQAAGAAAALCINTEKTPRELDTNLLREHLLSAGAII